MTSVRTPSPALSVCVPGSVCQELGKEESPTEHVQREAWPKKEPKRC